MNGLTAQRHSSISVSFRRLPRHLGSAGSFRWQVAVCRTRNRRRLRHRPVPDSSTPTDKLVTFYSAHHAQVWLGGMLYAWAAIPLVFFGAAMWARIRASAAHPVVAAAALVGTAIAAMSQLDGSGSYLTLGTIADKSYLAPATLQTLHIGGSGGSAVGIGGIVILLFAWRWPASSGARFRWLAWPRWCLRSST